MSRPRMWLLGSAVVVAVVAVLLWSWLGDDDGPPPATGQPATQVSGTITVLAAASLTEAFEGLADLLAGEYPDLEIVYSFGPSPGLAQQVLAGAPADVLVTANTPTMEAVVQAGAVVGNTQVIARNTMVLVTPADDPGGVTGLADLARDELRVAICEPQVPCGAAAETLLAEAGVEAAPDTLATDVKEALSLVTLGEVDAALVYQTDAVAARDSVRVVPVKHAEAVVNDYPAAVLAEAPNPEVAQAFVHALGGELGRSVLTAAGFAVP